MSRWSTPPAYAAFWSAVGALCAIVALIAYAHLAEPSGTTDGLIHALVVIAFGVFALCGLRAFLHVIERTDLSQQDKTVWVLWFWLGTPITVPLYLRRARL